MCDKLENQAFYANANAHRPPQGDAYINIYSNRNNNVLSVWQVFTTLHFPPFGFYDYYFFFFFVLFAAHGVRQLFEQMKLLIRYVFNFDKDSQTILQQQHSSSFDIFVCLRKCWGENLSWLLCKEIKCILSEINFIAALSERENKEGRKGGKGKNRRRRQG